jgi:hypothetical protein
MTKAATAVTAHRKRQRQRGLVRVEVSVPERDADIVRRLAAALRGAPEDAERARVAVANASGRKVSTLYDLVARPDGDAGLDALLDEILTRDRDLPRDVEL